MTNQSCGPWEAWKAAGSSSLFCSSQKKETIGFIIMKNSSEEKLPDLLYNLDKLSEY